MDDNQAVNALVRRCVSGDAAAWQEIVQQYHRRIYNICYRFSGSADDASDLAQEVFIKMYRTLSTFDTTRASFMTWVTTVTRNLLVDHFRKGKYDRITDSLDATPGNQEDGLTFADQLEDKGASPEARVRSQETQKLVHEALKRLSPGAAGGGDLAGLAGYGLQGYCQSPQCARGNCEESHKSGTNGTGEAVAT